MSSPAPSIPGVNPLLHILLSFVLALGRNTAIYQYLYNYIPLFNKIRYPVKFLFLTIIFISISTGLGWDSLKRNLEEGKKGIRWIILCLLSLATIAAIAFGGLSYFDKEVKDILSGKGIRYPEYNDININLFNTKRLLVIFIITVLSIYGSLRSIKARKILPYLIVSLLTIDLYFAHSGYYFMTKVEDYHRRSESMDFILKDKGPFRIFVTPKTKKGSLELGGMPYGINLEKEKIHGYNLESRIFDIEGSDVMRIRDYNKILTLLTTAPGPDATNLLALLNVRYLLSIPEIESDEFKLVKIIGVESGKDEKKIKGENALKIYENLNYLPRAFLVENYRILTDEEGYYKTLRDKAFRPWEEVLLYEEPWEGESGQWSVVRGEKDGVDILDYRNNSIKLRVNLDRPKILVMSETYYPGWKVFVDGKERKILKANFAFRAVALEPGMHKVEFIYDPWTFKVGLYITLVTVVSLGGVFVFYRRAR